jgi:predicted DNA repair protein MutK
MAGGLLMLLDDIATVLDDISVLTKVAVKKTAGVLGDDLALNAQQVTGVDANRELPVIWAVAKGSLANKAVLVPVALALSIFTPAWVIVSLLIMGGLYLCYEGCEKLAHKYLHPAQSTAHQEELKSAVIDPMVDMVALDDLGTHLIASGTTTTGPTRRQRIGYGILIAAPYLMKFLSVAGTAAMFLVGGGILAHGIPAIHHWVEKMIVPIKAVERVGPLLASLSEMLVNGLIGFFCGAIVLAVVTGIGRLRSGPT